MALRTVIQMTNPGADQLSNQSIDVLRKFLPEFSGTFLDVGCYGGWVYHLVKDKVDYTGIDISQTAVDAGKLLFGDRFICKDFQEYDVKHDIVWASFLQPEHLITQDSVTKLRSLSKKLLVIVDGSMVGNVYGASEQGDNWVAFRK